MKTIKEMSYKERNQLAELLENWLGVYTTEVNMKVMKRIEEIINNDMTMQLLKELMLRSETAKNERISSYGSMLYDIGDGKNIDDDHCLHNHCISHPGSYREVLYDMYIK